MSRTAVLVLTVFVALSTHSSATAQRLLGQKYLSASFSSTWAGSDPPDQGASIGISWPLGDSFHGSLSVGRSGFTGSWSDATTAGLGLRIHGDVDRRVAPYVGVSGSAAFSDHYDAYGAGLDVGVQFSLSSRIDLSGELGIGVADSGGSETITVYSVGMYADISLTERLTWGVGGSLGYSPDSYSDEMVIAAATGLTWRL